jgi:hypothetical protein
MSILTYIPGFSATNAYAGLPLQPQVQKFGTEKLRISGQDREATRYTLHMGMSEDAMAEHTVWVDHNQIVLQQETSATDLLVRLERYAYSSTGKN